MDEISVVISQFQTSLTSVINAEVRRQVSAIVREMPDVSAPVVEHNQRGPKKGSKAEPKPCPVTGVLNTHRRFSYLMPEVRTAENLAAFKRSGK